MSIHFFLILNRQGKTRLAKWFDNVISDAERAEITAGVHRLISSRDLKHQLNFVDFNRLKLVYRRYAGLYFVIAIDPEDNELSYLESVQFFVEILDSYFDNVCELDLVFNFYKLFIVLDEVYLGGELHETSKARVIKRLNHLDGLTS